MGFISELFEVQQELLNCVIVSDDEAVNTETGEVIDIEALEALKMDFNEKIYGLAKWHKNEKAYAEALKAEKLKLEKRQKQAENNADRLAELLDKFLQGEKFERPLVKVSYRKSQQVIVDDMSVLPEEFKRYKEPEADKTAIKKAFKEGQTVAGVHVVDVNNISVK